MPLSFAHAATIAWSGRPCISTEKLKVSFRYSGKCHCLEKSCSLRQEDQSLCLLSPSTYFLLTFPVRVKFERQPEGPSESISAGWSPRSSTHSCVALGFSFLFCKRVIMLTLNVRTTWENAHLAQGKHSPESISISHENALQSDTLAKVLIPDWAPQSTALTMQQGKQMPDPGLVTYVQWVWDKV